MPMLRAKDSPTPKPLEHKNARRFLPTSTGKHETGALKYFELMHPKLSEETLDVITVLHGLEPFHVSDLRRQSDEGFAEIGITNRKDINAIRRPVREVTVKRYDRPAYDSAYPRFYPPGAPPTRPPAIIGYSMPRDVRPGPAPAPGRAPQRRKRSPFSPLFSPPKPHRVFGFFLPPNRSNETDPRRVFGGGGFFGSEWNSTLPPFPGGRRSWHRLTLLLLLR